VLSLAAFAAHTVNSARFPVIQQKFDALLKAQLKGISQSEVDKAKAIALPIAYATLEERWVLPVTQAAADCRLYTILPIFLFDLDGSAAYAH
jgi:hypothetical protein